jgi:mannose-6-phosphate isomerase-like protein (cupin superfamily)
MSAYTIKNLKDDVKDAAPDGGLAPGLEAHFAGSSLDCEESGVSYFRVAPDFRIPFGHAHGRQEEVYVIVDGTARLNLDGEVHELRKWDAVRMSPEVTRNLEAGPEGAELLAFGAPNTGLGDAEMQPGWWTD